MLPYSIAQSLLNSGVLESCGRSSNTVRGIQNPMQEAGIPASSSTS